MRCPSGAARHGDKKVHCAATCVCCSLITSYITYTRRAYTLTLFRVRLDSDRHTHAPKHVCDAPADYKVVCVCVCVSRVCRRYFPFYLMDARRRPPHRF